MEISFGGCGFLGVYHIGVGKCFEDNARHLLKSFKGFYGASAGSICAAAAACRCDSMVAYKWVKKTVEASRVYRMGLLNPQFDLYTRLRTFLESYLPKDAHKRARGKVRISMTTFPDMKNYVVSDFTTRKELINVSTFGSAVYTLHVCVYTAWAGGGNDHFILTTCRRSSVAVSYPATLVSRIYPGSEERYGNTQGVL